MYLNRSVTPPQQSLLWRTKSISLSSSVVPSHWYSYASVVVWGGERERERGLRLLLRGTRQVHVQYTRPDTSFIPSRFKHDTPKKWLCAMLCCYYSIPNQQGCSNGSSVRTWASIACLAPNCNTQSALINNNNIVLCYTVFMTIFCHQIICPVGTLTKLAYSYLFLSLFRSLLRVHC